MWKIKSGLFGVKESKKQSGVKLILKPLSPECAENVFEIRTSVLCITLRWDAIMSHFVGNHITLCSSLPLLERAHSLALAVEKSAWSAAYIENSVHIFSQHKKQPLRGPAFNRNRMQLYRAPCSVMRRIKNANCI